MISKPGPDACFVYITLPGMTEPVTAARFELTTGRNGIPLGRLVYGKSYLERSDAVPFDPVELRLTSRVYETAMMKGVFGALRDACPDAWGRRIIERHLGQAMLSEIDYLLHSPDDRAGALDFGLGPKPPAPKRVKDAWYETARRAGVSEKDCAHIAGAFAYPGFDLERPGK
jgi:serine/threonine-protein kinase HipA